jgi:hypothetical protein
MLKWTITELLVKGKECISLDKLLAYIGLEIAMSLVPMGSIKEYWSTKHFSGHRDFCDTMSCNEFEEICAAIQFHPPGVFDEETKEKNTLIR